MASRGPDAPLSPTNLEIGISVWAVRFPERSSNSKPARAAHRPDQGDGLLMSVASPTIIDLVISLNCNSIGARLGF